MASRHMHAQQIVQGEFGQTSGSAKRPRTSQSTAPDGDAGEGLRSYLLHQYKVGKLSSEAVCTLAYHAKRAGATNVADLACNPSLRNQAEHLRKAIGARAERLFYEADVSMWDRVEEVRRLVKFPMCLPHEEFARCYSRNPDDYDLSKHPEVDLPPNFSRHEVVQAHKDRACPVGYFSDAVPHTKTDSFIVSIGAT